MSVDGDVRSERGRDESGEVESKSPRVAVCSTFDRQTVRPSARTFHVSVLRGSGSFAVTCTQNMTCPPGRSPRLGRRQSGVVTDVFSHGAAASPSVADVTLWH